MAKRKNMAVIHANFNEPHDLCSIIVQQCCVVRTYYALVTFDAFATRMQLPAWHPINPFYIDKCRAAGKNQLENLKLSIG